MSEINWHKIQRKLEGRCEMCGGDLPEHKGVCPVYGEELHKKWDGINKGIDDVEEAVQYILEKNKHV
jgi:RNA polymerase subunit RPABC4/transcription elongation factor Spt4